MIIFIKSFNRPYYLERCIQSVQLHVLGVDLKIVVLDDGTHPKYLNNIAAKFPKVEIRKSPFYRQKVEQISRYVEAGSAIGKLEIPTEFWLSSIKENQDDYFILLEDDMWFTAPVQLAEAIALMQAENMCLLKFFHFGNKRMISGELKQVSDEISTIKPKILFESPFLFRNIMLRNPFKVLSILRKLGLYNPQAKINYYTIYNVAGTIFSKAYYEHLWNGFKGLVDEDAQLLKAVSYYQTHKSKVSYGVYNSDVLSTSFSSSATNMFPDAKLDVFTYNHLLNEAWHHGKLDVMAGFPGDIAGQEITRILELENHENALPAEWRKWAEKFKAHYRSVGHTID
jgi:glycosyltransferase involved in cell wall biosynthesis